MKCVSCLSPHVHKKGAYTVESTGVVMQRYKCMACNHPWSQPKDDVLPPDAKVRIRTALSMLMEQDVPVTNTPVQLVTPTTQPDSTIASKNKHTAIRKNNISRYVISSVQNNSGFDQNFFRTLLDFCEQKSATLILLPTKYRSTKDNIEWHQELEPYIVDTEFEIGSSIKVLGDLFLLSTLENPLTGFDVVSKGKTIIIGHPQYQMKSLPVPIGSHPNIITTTGSLSNPNFPTDTKVGKKATFNHSFSAQYISVFDEGGEDEEFHIRALNWDGRGFYDIDGYYSNLFGYPLKPIVTALYTGDEHVVQILDSVVYATYTGQFSIVNTLKPEYIIRGDVFDGQSISHHHIGNTIKQNSKSRNDEDNLEAELNATCEFIAKTTPEDSISLIVASNHNEHLDRWLTDPRSVNDKKNSRLYHWFMYQYSFDENKTKSALEVYMGGFYPQFMDKVIFFSRNRHFMIHDIEVHHHGDVGMSGQFGTLVGFSKYPNKVIVGHSHAPGVNKSAYQVGTSTPLVLDYCKGSSTAWMNTHCLVYENGKRQLIHIINGRWYI